MTLFHNALSKKPWGFLNRGAGGGNTPRLKPAGYLVELHSGRSGESGVAYDYVMASNGLHIQAECPLIKARTLIAYAEVKGLARLQQRLELPNGPIPTEAFLQGLNWLKGDPASERYFAIVVHNGAHKLVIPEQIGSAAAVSYYRPPDNCIAEFHSHAGMDAFFSPVDDRDEQGFRIYGVVGRTGSQKPQLALRLGIYGYFRDIPWEEVFEQQCKAVTIVHR